MSNRRHHRNASYAFTLAELLIALAILGVIATFTIPKVLQAQQKSTWNATSKEALSMVSKAYQEYARTHTVTAATTVDDLTPYMNYVQVDTTSQFNLTTNTSVWNCNSTQKCLRLHNGGILNYETGLNFSGQTAVNALFFRFDPDGKDTQTGTDADLSMGIFVYINGRITTLGGILPGTTNSNYTFSAAGTDPTWLRWD